MNDSLVLENVKGEAVIPYLVRVELDRNEDGTTDDAFLKVRETLTRIGIASRRDENTLYQTCHILKKRDRVSGLDKYYIVHFKLLFALDGRSNTITESDIARQNKIVSLLDDWGLVSVVDKDQIEGQSSMSSIKVVSYKAKDEWNLIPKYAIGSSRKN